MKFLFILILSSSMVLADEEPKITPPSPEKACKLFGEVQEKLNKRQNDRNKTAVIVGGAALATIAFVEGARYVEIRNTRKSYEGLNKMMKNFDAGYLHDPYKVTYLKEVEYRALKRGFKKLVAATGIGTAVAFGAEVIIEGSITSALKNVAADFAPPLADSTMTAHYAKNPEKFMELNKVEACVHLAADKESPSAPFLRQSVLEMHDLLVNDQKETSDMAVNDSDTSNNGKADLQDGSSTKENSKKSAKAKAE